MARWSLWKREKTAFLLRGRPGHSDNVMQHITARGSVEILVTYDGLYWAKFQGEFRGFLFFSIELKQRNAAVLRDAQITFSFDCHPAEKECHTEAGDAACQNPDRRNRGVVQVALPSAVSGKKVNRHIARHDQYQVAPSFEFPAIGSLTLGSWQRDTEYTEDRARGWTFDSRRLPPTKYNTFPKLTNASYEYKYNENDTEDYPKIINVAVILDCTQVHPPSGDAEKSDSSLPLTLTIDGSLGRFLTHFSKLKNHEVSIATGDDIRDRGTLIQRIQKLNSQNDDMGVDIFDVKWPSTSENDGTVTPTADGREGVYPHRDSKKRRRHSSWEDGKATQHAAGFPV
ncbi:hypothetical protein KVR01_000416 [Diaporthe batatas]|uniref:uncharacterized protein n=1 Tax=Diaporthe batatas TaxID=748121 RepID=UPI001D05BB8F|nr:uncharacterized protein KVR01_000416 [Diaporthe batatas]KAG8169671.1 hypothetical protein KVR01_000416 [Diaporthe batatas]